MSNKSKKRTKKKAKVKVLNVTRIEPKRHFVALELNHTVEPTEELSTWGKLSKFMGWS